jgi:hypothetical protein
MADSCPNYLDFPSCMLSTCLPEFGSLALFGHPSMGDRLSYGSSEFRGMCAIDPKSEQETATLD